MCSLGNETGTYKAIITILRDLGCPKLGEKYRYFLVIITLNLQVTFLPHLTSAWASRKSFGCEIGRPPCKLNHTNACELLHTFPDPLIADSAAVGNLDFV